MDKEQKQRQEMEELVQLLSGIKGSHTELVTVLIPAGTNINQVSNQLAAERSTADNIKSKATRTAVTSALDMIVRELKNYRQTPKNGLAIFCGNISEKEGNQDIKYFSIEPFRPLKVRIYRCDKQFVTEPLKEMLDVEEVYGLLAIDRQEATIGLLEGKRIEVLRKIESAVPGKYKAGGQCLSPDTLIMKDDGDIIEIKDSHNPLLVLSENFNSEKTEQTPVIAKWENDKDLFEIETCYPKFKIKSSQNHTFFVRTENGIEEKPLSEIKTGDYLIMPEKINIDGKLQEIFFSSKIQRASQMKQIKMPSIITPEIAKIFGYYLGDGNYEVDRISFSEQRKEVAEYYCNFIETNLGVRPTLRFREDKNYYQIRVGSRLIAQLFRFIFEERDKTRQQKIPSIILKSPDNVLAPFVSGFFDAEGYISGRVGAGINNEKVIKQMQFALLRLGIIGSINEYDNRRNPYSKKIRYTLSIEDIESLKKFSEIIGFTSKEKQNKLLELINKRSNRNKVRQIVANGKEIARILRNSGVNTTQFACPDFFINKKQLSKELFKINILNKIENQELKRRLELFYLSNLIAVKIKTIRSLGQSKTIDIETKNHNFIANGLIVHNSSQRFERIREGMAKEFFREVAEAMKSIFFDMPKLKGILVGGPMPTKEDFLDQGELVTKLKEKVIAVKDLGYTGEHGLKLLVEASNEEIASQEIVKEKSIVKKFFETLGKNKEKACYGLERASLALQRGAVEILLISKKLDKSQIQALEKQAENIGSEVFIISTETPEGLQFYNLTKGIGAILRFALE